MTRLNTINPEHANGKAKDLFDAAQKKLGGVPNLLRVMANQPAVLEQYLQSSQVLAGGSFDGPTREAISLAVAGANECDYCASAHSFIAKSIKVDASEVELNLNGESRDSRLQAILTLALQIVEKKGFVSDDDLQQARAAGLDDEAIVEVVGNAALNIFTNYMNHVAQTDIDFPEVSTKKLQAA
ncbi:carboxymuconolactone decarboxylase family protein [bacterium]|nr:carboxymuconolactone decarboxylase family protein [bacterium]